MTFMIAMGLLSASCFLVGHIFGLAHGIETERKRWKIQIVPSQDERKDQE